MLRFGSIIAWLIVLCLAVCEAQEVRYPKWYASYSGGSINSTDVNDSTVLVSTDSALFLFDKSNGSLQHSIEITDRLIVGASLGSKSSVAWIVTSDGWSVDRVVSVEETDLATGLAIAKYVLPTNGTLGGIITGIRAGLSFSPDSTRLIVNLRYQEAIDRGYDYDYYQGSFWFIIDRTLGRIHRHSMSYLDDVEFAANDTIVLASYSTKSGRGNQSESVVQTSVYSLKDTVLNFIQKMNEKMQLSETKDYIFGRTSVCEWPSLKPLEFNNIVDLSGPLMFSLNGLGYLTKVSDYQTVCEYRDVASDKTLVKFVDSIVRSRAIWKISFLRNALINEGESNRISFWQLNDLPNSSRGLKRRFQDTIVENTATILKKPLIPPIGKPVTLDLSTNADYFSNWIVKTSYVNDCKIIMKAALYDGTNLLDTSQIVVRSLEHDDKAIDFISLGFKYAFVSHISANGRFVSVASKGNIYQAEVGSPFFKYFSGLSQFAVAGGPTSHSIASDNNGELYYTFRYYTGSELSSYHGQTFHVEYFDVDVGKIDSQDKHSKLHTKHTTVGIDHPTEVLTVTNPRWLEGFATYHSMVNDSPYGYFLYAVNSLNGDTVDVEKDLAGVAPYQMDYNYVKKRTLIWGRQQLQNYRRGDMELVVVEKNGQARRKPMTINFEHIGFTADAKHIVSSYGIFDLNLNIIEFPDRFKHNFLAVRGTHNGIEFNKDTLIMWRVPNVVERERVVLHDSIASVQSDTASRLLLVTFANGTVELFRMSDMFTNFDPILPREEQEESPTDTVETNAISEIRIYDILGNRIVEGAKPLSGIYLIVTITDEGITSEKVWLN